MGNSPWSNQAVTLIILTEQTTGFSGVFGYSPAVGTGNLIFSLAAAAGVDPYGNPYPQGLTSLLGSFSGTDYLINSTGEFFYYGTPAFGNLALSLTNAAGTDSFGNAFNQGINISIQNGIGNEIQMRPDKDAIFVYAG